MAYENTAGINVFNQYGPRSTGTSVGTDHTKGDIHSLSLEISGTSLQSTFLPPYVVPKGARFLRAYLDVREGFTLGGTSPTVQIGGTAPGTNGVTLTATQLGSVATIDISSALTGTWATNSAAGTTASEKVTLALGGTNPTVTSGVGKASVRLEYIYKNRTLGSVN